MAEKHLPRHGEARHKWPKIGGMWASASAFAAGPMNAWPKRSKMPRAAKIAPVPPAAADRTGKSAGDKTAVASWAALHIAERRGEAISRDSPLPSKMATGGLRL